MIGIRRGIAVLVAALALLALGPTGASAQAEGEEGDARMHFRLGRAYYDSGRFVEAAQEFQLAYDESQRPELLYNVFVAHRDAGNLEQAIVALREYLRLSPNAENREQLTARLATMEELLARQGSGAEAEPPEDATPGSTEPATLPPAEATVDGPPDSRASAGGGGGPWIPGFIIAGVGGAAIVVGAVLGGLALAQQSQLEADFGCDADGFCDPGFEDAASSGAALAGAADGLLFGGLAIAATGVVLAFVLADSGGEESAVAAGAACAGDGCQAVVRVRY